MWIIWAQCALLKKAPRAHVLIQRIFNSLAIWKRETFERISKKTPDFLQEPKKNQMSFRDDKGLNAN